jgi:LytS/YehU family sensor histidine kinase
MRREETVASVVDLEQLTGTLRAVRQRLDHDVRDAERLTQRLADLLRDALSTGDPSWTLDREHQHVSRFLEVSRARAPRELVLDWSVPADLERCHVARFSVKNAVSAVLSDAPAASPVRVSVEARGRDDARRLVVRGGGVEREVTLAVAESHGA